MSAVSVASTPAAGTISQTARGGSSFCASSSSEPAPTAPLATSACTFSGLAIEGDHLVT